MIYFASDFHLGAPTIEDSRKREKKILAWFNAIEKDATEIYLLGDLFDYWFEYKEVVPKGFVRIIAKLAELTDIGIEITLFKGNHDMWMFGYLQKECGVKIISNELIIQRNNKVFFLHHGDGLGKYEKGYKLMKAFFRSKLCQWLFARLHPNFGIWLMKTLSKKSRISKKGQDEKYLGDDKEFITRYCNDVLIKQNYDYMIFGHRHLPLEINIKNGSKYINLGEWVNYFTYAAWDGKLLRLLKWE